MHTHESQGIAKNLAWNLGMVNPAQACLYLVLCFQSPLNTDNRGTGLCAVIKTTRGSLSFFKWSFL